LTRRREAVDAAVDLAASGQKHTCTADAADLRHRDRTGCGEIGEGRVHFLDNALTACEGVTGTTIHVATPLNNSSARLHPNRHGAGKREIDFLFEAPVQVAIMVAAGAADARRGLPAAARRLSSQLPGR